METTVVFYERLAKTWDFEIQNNEVTLEEVGNALLSQLSSRVSGFQQYCKDSTDGVCVPVSSGLEITVAVGSGSGPVSASAGSSSKSAIA
jgi:hypothetical protein